MARPAQTAIVLTDPTATASSESQINAAVCDRLLPKLYRSVLVNPARMPRARTRFDLWSIFPWRCDPPIPWREITDRAEARIAIDLVDQMPGHDVYMTTLRQAETNITIDRLLGLWAVDWGGELVKPSWRPTWTKPHIPFFLPCSTVTVPADHPRNYAFWNVQHWSDRRDEHAVALAALPTLKTLGVEMVFVTRWDRGGVPFDDLADSGLEFCALEPATPAEQFDALFARSFAYLVSVPSVGMFSVDRALAQGIPVIGAPTHRWGEWFSTPEQLAPYRTDSTLYALRAAADEYLFGETTALAHMDMARRLARHLRGRSDA